MGKKLLYPTPPYALNQQLERFVLGSVQFKHNKQLAFGWLFIIASPPYWQVPIRTKQLSTVEVTGLVRALAHIGFPAIHFILLMFQNIRL